MMELRPYQLIGRDFLAARRHALLADEMRVGKTPQAILASVSINTRNVLVVAPAIALEQWRREWETWADRKAIVLDRGVWPRDGVVIASYNRATAMRDVLAACKWDLVIIDECHFAKNLDAKRTKAVYGKDGFAHTAQRLWALSGTPAPKNASELWPMMYTFGATKLPYTDFVNRYCRVDDLGKITGTKEATIPELRGLLAPVMLRRLRKEVAPDMPDIDFQFLAVRPDDESDYKVPDDLEGEALLAWLEAHRSQNSEDRQAVAAAKVEPLAEEIIGAFERGDLTQTVVFGYHIRPMHELTRLLEAAGLTVGLLTGATAAAERTCIQDYFRAGRLQVVVAQLIAAGTAIDLSAARHAYFLELDWLPSTNAQAANRLVNMDKLDKVTVDICTWPGSKDDAVQRVLARRVKEISQLI